MVTFLSHALFVCRMGTESREVTVGMKNRSVHFQLAGCLQDGLVTLLLLSVLRVVGSSRRTVLLQPPHSVEVK